MKPSQLLANSPGQSLQTRPMPLASPIRASILLLSKDYFYQSLNPARYLWIACLPIAVLLGNGRAMPERPPLGTVVSGPSYHVGPFLVSVALSLGPNPHLSIAHSDRPGRVLWESVLGVPFLAAGQGAQTVTALGRPEGIYEVRDRVRRQTNRQTIDRIEERDGNLVISGVLSGPQGDVDYRFTLRAVSPHQLQFEARASGPGAKDVNRWHLRYASSEDERIYGCGEQLTYFDQKGHLVPMMVQEHGVGRGLPLLTEIVNATRNGGAGNAYSTGAPAPQYLTSKLRSLFLENYEYSEFDLRQPDRIEINLFGPVLRGRILDGKSPLDLIEEYTAYAGRIRRLPDWTQNGAIVGVQGGTEAVRQKLAALDQAGVPVAALWIQDWCGRRVTADGYRLWWNWQLDEAFYPGWSDLVAELARRNIRVMTYINPFFVNDPGHDRQFRAAASAGYLVKRSDGSPYLIPNRGFSFGIVDLSNPRACAWMKQIIKDEVIARGGASGWMADFGETLPFDSALSGGEDPAAWHNRYAEKWAEINRQAVEESGRKDIAFFSRSAFTKSPGLATMFWLSDQLQTWDEFDGMKTAVTGMLSGGVSGFSLLHSDAGGYNASVLTLGDKKITVMARSPELLMRWVELGAFSSTLRTHEGNQPFLSAQFDHDGETLAHFARMAKVYKALGFYRKMLGDEAARTGHPLVRHPFLEFPDDPNTYDLRYQFMLGPELMVAPVVDPGMQSVTLYLPHGNWVNVWSGELTKVSTGKWLKAPAPLGKPAVFYRQGSAVGMRFVAELKSAGLD